MNNRYICKGKRIDNNEWVEGYLYITHDGEYEIGKYDETVNIERMTYIVIPETVCRCTELKDKNGKWIFEGDVVKTQPFSDKPYSSSDGDNPKYEQEQISALKLAVEALEKQIPQKVIFGDDEQDDIFCPTCRFALATVDNHEYERMFYNYCPHCGIKLDWE